MCDPGTASCSFFSMNDSNKVLNTSFVGRGFVAVQ